MDEVEDEDIGSPRHRLSASSKSILEEIGVDDEVDDGHDASSCSRPTGTDSGTRIHVSVVDADDDDGDYAPGPRGEVDAIGVERNGEANEEEADEEEALLEAGGAEAKSVDAIRGWEELREEIKGELKRLKKSKGGRLTEINQLLIIRNFATLCLKGLGRMAASEHIAQEWHESKDGVQFCTTSSSPCTTLPAFRAASSRETRR